MVEIIVINIIALIIAFYSGVKNNREKLWWLAIIILVVFFGIRYNYGNDYLAAYDGFININRFGTIDNEYEYGWIILCRIFGSLGFFGLVLFITFIQFISVGWLINEYCYHKDRWVALFFYLFTSTLMFYSLVILRQCMAMSIIIFSVPFILKRKLIPSLLIIILAAQFHTSAYFMLLLPFTVFLNRLNKKAYVILILSLLVSLFALIQYFNDNFYLIVSMIFPDYLMFQDKVKEFHIESGLGLMSQLIGLIIALYYDPHDGSEKSWFMKIYAVSYLFIPLNFVVPIMFRLTMYYQILTTIGLSIIYHHSKKDIVTLPFILLFAVMTVIGFRNQFDSDVWEVSVKEYKTIIGLPWR